MTAINESVAQRLTRHLREGTTDMGEQLRVPVSHFVSPEHAARERKVLMRRPLIIGRGSEIPKKGNFITREVLGIPLIVVRKADGGVASYLNICKHRGGRVENAESGSKRFFTCNYHGWSYSCETGRLRGVPYDEFYTYVDREEYSLNTVQTTEWQGFLFVNFGDAEQPIEDWMGPEVKAQLEDMGVADSVIYMHKSFTLDINWKLVLDGAIDVLHPKFLHPNGVGKLIETNTSVWREYGHHGQSFSPRTKLSKIVEAGEEPEAAWKLIGSNLFLYPNSSVIPTPDHVEFWTVWPDPENPGRSTTEIRFLVRPDVLDERMEARINKSWEILKQAAMEEDWPMEETIQKNSEAWPYGSYLYGRNEQPCQHLHRRLAADMAEFQV
ncbi:phenylpropionate dioxygenase-like ring-hydroxylating dioxygenase large terminal subunit [Actinomadura hallensis]|uniref:Phenylpropionate dioxygenase-like ring-hydroxylating dioxygenase large terminal subunit n=1 Tax=Actinomadura hallensis TaxID=337895 RepID=A0A543IGN5_9ACTN|nr:aromatic ring-hydroxylating dioxygenase subunit alpha [Actinomadura hallensis]TQM69736.1 phenylpropionate dioxygenase-like ring-hydroxylating dioxygenase large terminal subunit [Actinomadura hallensis]